MSNIHLSRGHRAQADVAAHVGRFLRKKHGSVAVDIHRSKSISVIEDVGRMGSARTAVTARPNNFLGIF